MIAVKGYFCLGRHVRYHLGEFFRIIFLLILLIVLLPATGMAMRQTGPLGVLNQFPIHWIFLTPRPHSLHAISENTITGAVSFNYFSIYSDTSSSTHSHLMDMEAMVLDIRLAYGLTDDLSFGAIIPMASMQDGFMDHSLEWFHRSFGLPNYGKERRPKDEFAYVIEKNGQVWFKAKKGGLNLLDSTFFTQLDLIDFRPHFPAIAGLTYQAKIPSGDETHGFGSGAWDHGIFIPIKVSFSAINVYLTPGYIFINTPEFNNSNISTCDIKSLFLGGEYLYSSNLSLLAQINSYTSPFKDTGIEKLDVSSVELALGVRWAFTPQLDVEMAFCEDLTRSAPDFNLHIMLNLKIP
jgi:hypothetical protein